FIDLDRFKYINDTLGHDVGDRLLMTVARRLRGSLRESDTVARLGGDEFAVVLEGISRPEEAIMVGEKLRHAVSRPYRIDGHQVFTSPSIGLSFFPDDASSVDGLRKCADLAMYRAKSVGRDRLERYDPKLSRGERSTVALIDEVESALGKGQFLLHYAPVYSTGSDCVDGFEALLRWDHPSHGLLSPDQFMSAVDDAGLNSRLTAEVLRKACVQMAALSKRTERRLRVALDVPGTQLGEDGFMSAIANALRASALPPEQLELELAEADLLQDYDLIVRRLAGLRAANIGICISEFGTGYSSLGRLHRLPATKLKLSGSFMNGLPFDQDNRKFLCAMASMTDTLGLALAVEDVDTSEQARYLKQAGCAYMQGRHIGLPDTAKSILAARQV
ncbi:MAG: bifunctional diguanylate cyclase/phosphodiesterase, partial [Gammaproteobacteria bacterium]|nr:bifunctional diguanylate cyclase/phosphodiesterase [Gammaproteobacteria bacterium]